MNTLERDGIFEKCFFPFYLKLGYQEHNYSVQLHIIKSLPLVRAAIIKSGDVTANLKLNQMISDMKDKREGMLADTLSKLCETSRRFRSDAEMARVSAMHDGGEPHQLETCLEVQLEESGLADEQNPLYRRAGRCFIFVLAPDRLSVRSEGGGGHAQPSHLRSDNHGVDAEGGAIWIVPFHRVMC